MMRCSSPGGFLLFFIASVAMLAAAGCSVEDALVGGQCAPGYVQCGLHCVRGTSCASPEDASGNAAADAPPEAAADGSQTDSAPEEGVGTADGGGDDGPNRDASQGDASGIDSGSTTDAVGGDTRADADAVDGGVMDATADSMEVLMTVDASDSGGADSNDSGLDGTGDSGATDSGFEDAANPDAADDAEAGNPCTPPLVFCGGACIDVSADPLNCGACNVVCASQLCQNSRCVGAAPGGIVYAGHDYTTTLPGTAQARVLSNAVFIPQANPLHVMSYERYASANAITHVNNILNGVATQIGRTLNVFHTTSDTDIPAQLALPGYDVLLVHDQPTAPDGALTTLGASWASTLTTFTLGGGIVVVLDGGTGIQQMPSFATGTGLLNVTANSPVALSTPLIVASRVDVVGIGVISPYGAGQSTVSIATEPNGGNVVYVVELSSDAGSAAPVVVHKAF